MINMEKIQGYDITTHQNQNQHGYKIKEIRSKVEIIYTKDAIAGAKKDNKYTSDSAIPVNYGVRVYVGKEANRNTLVAIKEITVKHTNNNKNTDRSKLCLESLKKTLFVEVDYMRRAKSACGPIDLFYNSKGSRLYVVQNLMTGTAIDILDAIRPTEKVLPLRSTVLFMCTLAARHLQELHAQNILHFDIKPLNLMYSKQQNRVEFIDYGLSGDGPQARPSHRGTPAYASQAQDGLFICSKRDELVSLGVTFIELMTKQALFFDRRDGIRINHHTFEYRNYSGQDSRVTAEIARVLNDVHSRHPLFKNLCERMIDTRQNPVLTAEFVSDRLADMIQQLEEDEYDTGLRAWNSIPDYVERIQKKIDSLVNWEQERIENN